MIYRYYIYIYTYDIWILYIKVCETCLKPCDKIKLF